MYEKVSRRAVDRWAKTRLKESDFQAWSNLVVQLRSTKSKLMRQLIREAVGRGPESFLGEFQELFEANKQVAAVGRLLNQIARHLNSGEHPALDEMKQPVEEVLSRIDKLENALEEVIFRSRNRWLRSGREGQ